MGLLSSEIVKFLQEIRATGIKGKTLAMMGKQDILVDWNSFMKTIKELEFEYDQIVADRINGQRIIDTFDFFKMFGFLEVHAVDYSEYEGADIVFDLNDELPEYLKGKFDYVINGGTLEHVFDIAKAMDNMSKMVKKGGMIMHISPVDGWVNHGFYSISPTFFQDYYGANGFSIKKMDFEFIMSPALGNGGAARTFYSEDLRLFQNSRQLNDYIASLKNVREADSVLLVCFAERQKEIESDGVRYPIQGFYQKIYGQNGNDSVSLSAIDFEKAVQDILCYAGKKALYGCGHVCDILLDELHKCNGEQSINIIFDGNIRKAGTNHRGCQVLYPTVEKLLSYDRIYICSSDYEGEIKKELLEKGIPQECIRTLSELI